MQPSVGERDVGSVIALSSLPSGGKPAKPLITRPKVRLLGPIQTQQARRDKAHAEIADLSIKLIRLIIESVALLAAKTEEIDALNHQLNVC